MNLHTIDELEALAFASNSAKIEGDMARRLMDDPELAQQKATRAARSALRSRFLLSRLAAPTSPANCPACSSYLTQTGGGGTPCSDWAAFRCDCPRRYWYATREGSLPWQYDYESSPHAMSPRESTEAATQEPAPCPCGVDGCACECEGDADACECPDNPESAAYGCADCARSYGPGRPCRCEAAR